MDEIKTNPTETTPNEDPKIKTRAGSGYLKQLFSTARTTAETTHSHLRNLTTFLVNFIPVEKVDPSELQVRVHFDDAEVQTLANSIKEHGVLQPILVVQDGDRYKVIAGERRLRATKLAGLERIPARVLSTTDKATHEIALRENLDRVDLHPIEEGEGYLSLLENQTYTSYESIAKAFGKPKSRITECIGYTRLPDETKWELMRRGLKHRSLFRTLLNSPIEQHAELMTQATGQPEDEEGTTQTPVTKPTKPREKKEPQPFAYQCSEKKIMVPGFSWKIGEGPERLQAYLTTIQSLAKEVGETLQKLG